MRDYDKEPLIIKNYDYFFIKPGLFFIAIISILPSICIVKLINYVIDLNNIGLISHNSSQNNATKLDDLSFYIILFIVMFGFIKYIIIMYNIFLTDNSRIKLTNNLVFFIDTKDDKELITQKNIIGDIRSSFTPFYEFYVNNYFDKFMTILISLFCLLIPPLFVTMATIFTLGPIMLNVLLYFITNKTFRDFKFRPFLIISKPTKVHGFLTRSYSKDYFIYFYNNEIYNEVKEYFLTTQNLNIDKVKKNYFIL